MKENGHSLTLPERKRLRMKDYRYDSNGCYFVTICTHNKQNLLCQIVGEGLCALPKTVLTPIGAEVEQAIRYMGQHYPGVTLDAYVIMPNHIHLLITIDYSAGGHGGPPLQQIVGRFKSFCTHRYGTVLWQRSFYDHIVRNEEDRTEIIRYIQNNPLNWRKDSLFRIGRLP